MESQTLTVRVFRNIQVVVFFEKKEKQPDTFFNNWTLRSQLKKTVASEVVLLQTDNYAKNVLCKIWIQIKKSKFQVDLDSKSP